MSQHNIRGTVLDSYGRPLAGATIAVVEGSASFPDMAAVTSDDGSFSLGPLSNGEYTVQAFGPSGNSAQAKAVVRDSSAVVRIRLE